MDTSETYIKMEQGLPDKPIPHTAIAYLGGLIDGEGTVSLRRKIGNHFNIEVYITSSNKPMLEWVRRVFGGKIYTYNRKGDTTRLPQHKWHIHSRGAEDLLKMVLPYLIIKGEHARLAIEFRELMDRNTSWHREFADKIKNIQKTITYTEPSHRISQDQLQEMIAHHIAQELELAPNIAHLKFAFLDFAEWIKKQYLDEEYVCTPLNVFSSGEQLWLAFVMKEKYGKVWDGENWKELKDG